MITKIDLFTKSLFSTVQTRIKALQKARFLNFCGMYFLEQSLFIVFDI